MPIYEFYDLATRTDSIGHWMLEASLSPIDTFSAATYQITELLKYRPMCVLFMDDSQASLDTLIELESLASLYPQIIFLYNTDP